MRYLKAIVSLLEILLVCAGVIPVSTHVEYGGDPYAPPAVETPTVLAENGGSDYAIVLPDVPDECEQTAAAELQAYLKKLTGAELPVGTETAARGRTKKILLGETEEGIALCPEIGTESAEGFRLRCAGDALVVRGGSPRGTLYGVYTLLEEYFGVRWFTPELEYVPEGAAAVVDAALDRTVSPSFAVRRNDPPKTNDAFRARSRMNVSFRHGMEIYGGALQYVLWDVTTDRLVPDALFETRPDYFALQPDGTRSTDHICMTSPGALRTAIENARAAIEADTSGAKYLHIGQKDNQNYCRCPCCEAVYEKYGSVSAAAILFTNALAETLGPEYPDFTFTFYAYLETDSPPADETLRCAPNVAPVLCGLHNACRSHPLTECGAVDGDDSFLNLFGENEPKIAEDLARWVSFADRTYIYDYTINFLNSAQFFPISARCAPR